MVVIILRCKSNNSKWINLWYDTYFLVIIWKSFLKYSFQHNIVYTTFSQLFFCCSLTFVYFLAFTFIKFSFAHFFFHPNISGFLWKWNFLKQWFFLKDVYILIYIGICKTSDFPKRDLLKHPNKKKIIINNNEA